MRRFVLPAWRTPSYPPASDYLPAPANLMLATFRVAGDSHRGAINRIWRTAPGTPLDRKYVKKQ